MSLCFSWLWYASVAQAEETELLIQFAPGTSPYELQQRVSARKDSGRSPFGRVKITLEDMTLQFLNKLTPEERLERLSQINKQLGVVMTERLLLDIPAQEVYVVHINGSWSIEQAEMLYSSVPEIVFAEQNILFSETL